MKSDVISIELVDDLEPVEDEVVDQSFDPLVVLAHSLDVLRLASMVHKNSHWAAGGEPFYGDHLMFERLYESAVGDVDSLAERIIGLYDEREVSLMSTWERIAECESCHDVMSQQSFDASISVEEHALQQLEDAYAALDESDAKTLGIDDLLMSICSNRETSMYLLKQRRGPKMK